MESTNDQPVQQLQVLPPQQSQPMSVRDPESILRFAVESKASVEVIERMMAVRKQLRDEQSKEAFDAALAAFQAECPVIEKKKSVADKGGGTRYKYAPLDDIVSTVKELLQKHGFSYSLTAKVDQGWVEAICTVTHRAGHSHQSEFKVPIDDKAYMNQMQKFAAALTYAKRYAFCNAFGILTGDEDTDATGNKPEKPQGPSSLQGDKAANKADIELKKRLVDMTRSIHLVSKGYALDDADKGKLTQWLIDENCISDTETVSDLADKRLSEVVDKVAAKIRGAK